MTFELRDAVTEPKVVVLDCSGENLVELASLPPFVPPLCDMLGAASVTVLAHRACRPRAVIVFCLAWG